MITRKELLSMNTNELQTKEQCEQWIEDLNSFDLLYHFHDNPKDIEIFEENELENVTKLVAHLFVVLDDPFEKACALIK